MTDQQQPAQEQPPTVSDYPDLDEYREASFQHAESHYEAVTDPEFCEADDCPHWPAWWTKANATSSDA